MKLIIISILALMPNMALAVTNCHVVEDPDHYEVICEGNEKSSPDISSKAGNSAPSTPLEAQQNKKNGVASPAMSPVKVAEPITPYTQRHGRQQFQEALKVAKEMRAKQISEEQINQPRPDFTPTPTAGE